MCSRGARSYSSPTPTETAGQCSSYRIMARRCERRESRAAVLSQAGAPLSWTRERQRARKAAANERQPQRAERAIYMKRAERAIYMERAERAIYMERAERAIYMERAEAFLNQRTSQRAER